MSRRTSRRDFVKTTAALGVGYWALGGIATRESRAAIEEVRFACIGVGGKGDSDSADAADSGKVVAICDIDDERLDAKAQKLAARHPDVKKYNDFRKLFDEMEKSIDAITV